jgi:hypothetical protein
MENEQVFQFDVCVAVAFHNQISIYGINMQMRQSTDRMVPKTQVFVVKDIVVEDLSEDIKCAAYDHKSNLLAFAGELGIIYVQKIGRTSTGSGISNRLIGHFKTVN